MRTLTISLLGLTAYAQMGLDLPRFGCSAGGGRVTEYLGVERNVASRTAAVHDAVQAVCTKDTVLVQRGKTVYANEEARIETSGNVLLAAAGGRAAVLDVEAGRLHWLDSNGWHNSPAKVPAGAASLATDHQSVWVLAGARLYKFDPASGEALESRALADSFGLASVLPDGSVLGVRERMVHHCSAIECRELYELPAEALALKPLNADWFEAELAGGARAALSPRTYFLLPGDAE
jgi:hypothetical protein